MSSDPTNVPLAIAGTSVLAASAIHQYLGETRVLLSVDDSKELSGTTKDVIRVIWNFSTMTWVSSALLMLKYAFQSPVTAPSKLILDYFAFQFGSVALAFLPGYILKKTKPRFYFQIPLFILFSALIHWGNKRMHP